MKTRKTSMTGRHSASSEPKRAETEYSDGSGSLWAGADGDPRIVTGAVALVGESREVPHYGRNDHEEARRRIGQVCRVVANRWVGRVSRIRYVDVQPVLAEDGANGAYSAWLRVRDCVCLVTADGEYTEEGSLPWSLAARPGSYWMDLEALAEQAVVSRAAAEWALRAGLVRTGRVATGSDCLGIIQVERRVSYMLRAFAALSVVTGQDMAGKTLTLAQTTKMSEQPGGPAHPENGGKPVKCLPPEVEARILSALGNPHAASPGIGKSTELFPLRKDEGFHELPVAQCMNRTARNTPPVEVTTLDTPEKVDEALAARMDAKRRPDANVERVDGRLPLPPAGSAFAAIGTRQIEARIAAALMAEHEKIVGKVVFARGAQPGGAAAAETNPPPAHYPCEGGVEVGRLPAEPSVPPGVAKALDWLDEQMARSRYVGPMPNDVARARGP